MDNFVYIFFFLLKIGTGSQTRSVKPQREIWHASLDVTPLNIIIVSFPVAINMSLIFTKRCVPIHSVLILNYHHKYNSSGGLTKKIKHTILVYLILFLLYPSIHSNSPYTYAKYTTYIHSTFMSRIKT